ncbi:hypothetical protein Dimus_008246 [Dionaea muscipula]
MPTRSGLDHQATSSNAQARLGRPPRGPGVTIGDAPREVAEDPEDGIAIEYQWFTQMHGPSGAPPAPVTPTPIPVPPPAPPVVPRAAVVLPPEEIQGRSFDRFVGAHPPKFTGTPNVIEASNWLMEIEEILQRIGCLPEHRVSHTTYMLERHSKFWWRGVRRRFDARGEEPTWEEFVTEFERSFHRPLEHGRRRSC